jgi:cobalt/nickel transport system ATP-binding protein
MDSGRIVADGDVSSVLTDSELLARHRLELPWGFEIRTK